MRKVIRPAIIVVLVMLGIGVCGWYLILKPIGQTLCLIRPDSVQNIHLYPDAQQVTEENPPYKAKADYNLKMVTFVTQDSPGMVYRYYEQLLASEGWRSSNLFTTDPQPGSGEFYWNCGFDTPNRFATLDIYSEATNQGETKMTLILEYLP